FTRPERANRLSAVRTDEWPFPGLCLALDRFPPDLHRPTRSVGLERGFSAHLLRRPKDVCFGGACGLKPRTIPPASASATGAPAGDRWPITGLCFAKLYGPPRRRWNEVFFKSQWRATSSARRLPRSRKSPRTNPETLPWLEYAKRVAVQSFAAFFAGGSCKI